MHRVPPMVRLVVLVATLTAASAKPPPQSRDALWSQSTLEPADIQDYLGALERLAFGVNRSAPATHLDASHFAERSAGPSCRGAIRTTSTHLNTMDPRATVRSSSTWAPTSQAPPLLTRRRRCWVCDHARPAGAKSDQAVGYRSISTVSPRSTSAPFRARTDARPNVSERRYL